MTPRGLHGTWGPVAHEGGCARVVLQDLIGWHTRGLVVFADRGHARLHLSLVSFVLL